MVLCVYSGEILELMILKVGAEIHYREGQPFPPDPFSVVSPYLSFIVVHSQFCKYRAGLLGTKEREMYEGSSLLLKERLEVLFSTQKRGSPPSVSSLRHTTTTR